MTKPKDKASLVFPIVIKCNIVAKFLCSYGQNEKLINFQETHKLFLEREPQNKYDQRAIKIGVIQEEKYLKIAGNENINVGDNSITLYLGYVPKDISFNLSVLLDNP